MTTNTINKLFLILAIVLFLLVAFGVSSFPGTVIALLPLGLASFAASFI